MVAVVDVVVEVVASLADAWIETIYPTAFADAELVASLADAWIETPGL